MLKIFQLFIFSHLSSMLIMMWYSLNWSTVFHIFICKWWALREANIFVFTSCKACSLVRSSPCGEGWPAQWHTASPLIWNVLRPHCQIWFHQGQKMSHHLQLEVISWLHDRHVCVRVYIPVFLCSWGHKCAYRVSMCGHAFLLGTKGKHAHSVNYNNLVWRCA